MTLSAIRSQDKSRRPNKQPTAVSVTAECPGAFKTAQCGPASPDPGCVFCFLSWQGSTRALPGLSQVPGNTPAHRPPLWATSGQQEDTQRGGSGGEIFWSLENISEKLLEVENILLLLDVRCCWCCGPVLRGAAVYESNSTRSTSPGQTVQTWRSDW